MGNSPHATVLIRLFGWLAFRVHFLRLTVDGPRLSYKHDLDTNQDEILVNWQTRLDKEDTLPAGTDNV